MNKLIEKFLDTKYSDDLRVITFDTPDYKGIDIYCNDSPISTGIIKDSGNYMFVSWTVHYTIWNEIYTYIPLVSDSIDSDVITWVRKKCKSQGIPFVSPTVYNLK